MKTLITYINTNNLFTNVNGNGFGDDDRNSMKSWT